MTIDYFISLFLVAALLVPTIVITIRGLYSLFKELR